MFDGELQLENWGEVEVMVRDGFGVRRCDWSFCGR
jgi:hypothetical protein